jgi:Pilus formation protein N terminal region
MRVRTALLAAVSLALVGQAEAAPKPHHKAPVKHRTVTHPGDRGVAVVMDEVRVVTFQRPIATVFVGNPMIADATVIDPYHAFVLGKTFGVTNLVALGPQSQPVANQQITVSNRGGGVVTLNKGAAQFTYSCTLAHCESNTVPGDQKAFFDDTTGSISNHQDQAIKAANASMGH